MGVEEYTRTFTHRKKRYRAKFLRRPFREGLEVSVKVGDAIVRIGELGLGEKATIEKLKAEIDKIFGKTN